MLKTQVAHTPPDNASTSLEVMQPLQDLRQHLLTMRWAGSALADGSPHAAGPLDEVELQVQRAMLLMNALARDGHALSSGGGAIDANEVVRRTVATVAHPQSIRAVVQLRLWPEPLPVLAEAGDLDDVLLNLVLKAIDPVQAGGLITIETGIARLRGTSDAGPSGPWARLTITDAGLETAPQEKRPVMVLLPLAPERSILNVPASAYAPDPRD